MLNLAEHLKNTGLTVDEFIEAEGRNVTGVDFTDVSLPEVLRGAFSHCLFKGASVNAIEGARFYHCGFAGATFRGEIGLANFTHCSFRAASMTLIRDGGASFHFCDFEEATLLLERNDAYRPLALPTFSRCSMDYAAIDLDIAREASWLQCAGEPAGGAMFFFDAMPSGSGVMVCGPSGDAPHITIGCWDGTLEELENIALSNSPEDWPSLEEWHEPAEVEMRERRGVLLAAIALCRARLAIFGRRSNIDRAVELANVYGGDDIWQDVILRLPGYDSEATEAVDPHGRNDAFVIDGRVIRHYTTTFDSWCAAEWVRGHFG